MDNSGQFWTVLDKFMWYNDIVKGLRRICSASAQGSEDAISFYISVFIRGIPFSGQAAPWPVFLRQTQRQRGTLLCPARIAPLKVVAQCRTMPHNVARRPRQYLLYYKLSKKDKRAYPARRKPNPKSCHRMSPKVARQMSQYVL